MYIFETTNRIWNTVNNFFKICSKTVNLPVLYAKSHKTPPNINTYCPLTASFPLTKAKLNLTWKMLWFPSLLIFHLLVFMLLSPEQLTVFPNPQTFSESKLCAGSLFPWQSKHTLLWASFSGACCCTIFLTAIMPQNSPFHVRRAFSAQPSFPLLEWNGNSLSEDWAAAPLLGSFSGDNRFVP